MKTYVYTIKEAIGLHARPANLLVMETKKYTSDITVENQDNGKRANAKSILGVLTICAKCGNTIKILTEGTDEEIAIESLRKFCQENL